MLETDCMPSFPGEDKPKFWPRFLSVLGRFCGSERGNQTFLKLSRAN
jgi:hypothetical protein